MMDAIFRKSKRMRPKWDEVHSADGKTYEIELPGRF
ncbi:hypothetical protein [Lactobacillus hominis]